MYRTFPLSTTSFSAFMISSRGVSRSKRWICSTSMYVPRRSTLASTASKMCLRDKPVRLTKGPSFVADAAMGGNLPSSSTPKKHLVRITTRLRGMLYFFRAFPTTSSDLPWE